MDVLCRKINSLKKIQLGKTTNYPRPPIYEISSKIWTICGSSGHHHRKNTPHDNGPPPHKSAKEVLLLIGKLVLFIVGNYIVLEF